MPRKTNKQLTQKKRKPRGKVSSPKQMQDAHNKLYKGTAK